MCNDCYYNIWSGVCPIFETYKRNLYSYNKIRIPRNIELDTEFLNGGEKFWIRRCLKPQSYNCNQEIQKYIRITCNNVLDIIIQNQGQTLCRQVCDDFYYNIGNGVCPIFETYNTTFIKRIRMPRNTKQDTKSLKRGRNF